MTIDAALSPAPKRIAYGGGIIAPVMDINSSAMACNRFPRPAPGDVARGEAAGLTFGPVGLQDLFIHLTSQPMEAQR